MSFQRRFFAAAAIYPRLRRGGLTKQDLIDLARRYGRRLGLDVIIDFGPWPWRGSIRRLGNTIVINIDNRTDLAEQVGTLAHEVGHLVLGHYRLEPFWADSWTPANRSEELEADLFCGLVLDRCVSPIQHLGGDEQLRLELDMRPRAARSWTGTPRAT